LTGSRSGPATAGGLRFGGRWGCSTDLWSNNPWLLLFFLILLVKTIIFIWLLFSALLIFQSFNMVLNKKWANFTLVFLILVILINEWVFL
jgi:hypothetical protein